MRTHRTRKYRYRPDCAGALSESHHARGLRRPALPRLALPRGRHRGQGLCAQRPQVQGRDTRGGQELRFGLEPGARSVGHSRLRVQGGHQQLLCRYPQKQRTQQLCAAGRRERRLPQSPLRRDTLRRRHDGKSGCGKPVGDQPRHRRAGAL